MNEAIQINLRRAWLNHCRGEEHFPRAMLFLTHKEKRRNAGRILCPDFNTLYQKAMFFMGKRSSYVAVYCEKCREQNIVDMVYIDLDNEDLDVTYDDMKAISEVFPATVYFTGKGGFAVYLKTFSVRLKHPRMTIRKFVEMLEKQLGLSTIDWHVVGDMKRVSRLPYTVNMKNEKLCIPISPKWSMTYILEQSEKVTEYLPVLFKPSPMLGMLLKEIDNNMKELKVQSVNFERFNTSKLKEEVQQLLELAPKIYDGRHTLIFHGIVPRMILCGATDEEILAVVREFIERTPDNEEKASMDSYLAYARRDITNTRKRLMEGLPVKFRMDSIMLSRPELLKYFKR